MHKTRKKKNRKGEKGLEGQCVVPDDSMEHQAAQGCDDAAGPSLQRAGAEVSEDDECVICMELARTFCFIPCGHLVSHESIYSVVVSSVGLTAIVVCLLYWCVWCVKASVS